MKISDLMDSAEPRAVELQVGKDIPLHAVKSATLHKIRAATHRPIPRLSKLGLIAAIVAGVLCVTAAGAASVLHWTGFAETEKLSGAEKASLLEQAASTGTQEIDQDGNVHFIDGKGNEVVLSAEEAAAAEKARQEARDRAVAESTALVDLTTMEFMPNSVTELATDETGSFNSFMLGNAHMVLLHPIGEDGYTLQAGDTVTISLEAGQKCYLDFGLFQNGKFIDAETVHAQDHCYTFEIAADGCYCFSIEYLSASADELTGGRLTVNKATPAS